MALQEWSQKVIEELVKHAERDNCYTCIQLLRQLAEVYGVKYETLLKTKGKPQ